MDLSLFNKSNLLYTEESLPRYFPGGYHSVSLGDTFKSGRYNVRHKLGWGGFSTVWLAKDTVSVYRRNQIFVWPLLTVAQPKPMGLAKDHDRRFGAVSRLAEFEAPREAFTGEPIFELYCGTA